MAQLDKHIKKMQDDNKKQQEMTNNLKTKNNKDKETMKKQKELIKQLEKEKKDLEKELEATRNRLTDHGEKLTKEREENARLRRQKNEAEIEAKENMTQVRNLQEENRQLNEQLNSIRTANRNQQQQQAQIATKKETRMSIVGDSNARNIYHQLRRLCPEEMEISLTEAFTTQQLEQWAENISDQEEFKDTRVYIHVGTNDLRHGGKATECMDSLKYVSHMLETLEIEHFLVQIPPANSDFNGDPGYTTRQAIRLNMALKTEKNNTITTEELEETPNSIGNDGIHLTAEGSTIVARKILQHHKTTETTNSKEPRQRRVDYSENEMMVTIRPDTANQTDSNDTEIKTTRQEEPATTAIPDTQQNNQTRPGNAHIADTMKTTHQQAAIVIGKKGIRIKNTKATFDVQIETERTEEGTTFVIRGPQTNVKKAKDAIEHIVKTTKIDETKVNETQYPTTNNTKRDTICRHFLQGQCSYGNNCLFLHQNGPCDISIRSIPETSTPTAKTPQNSTQRSQNKDNSQQRGEDRARKTQRQHQGHQPRRQTPNNRQQPTARSQSAERRQYDRREEAGYTPPSHHPYDYDYNPEPGYRYPPRERNNSPIEYHRESNPPRDYRRQEWNEPPRQYLPRRQSPPRQYHQDWNNPPRDTRHEEPEKRRHNTSYSQNRDRDESEDEEMYEDIMRLVKRMKSRRH